MWQGTYHVGVGMKLVRGVTAIFDYIVSLCGTLVVVLLIFMMLAVSTEVVMRYFLNRPPIWVIEVTEYALLYITFLGAAWLLKREGHVKMDLVLNRLNPRTQTLVNIVTSVFGAIICLVLTWYGVKVTWDHFQLGSFLSTILRPPSFLIVAIIPVGSFLLFIQFLRRTYQYLGMWRASRVQEA